MHAYFAIDAHGVVIILMRMEGADGLIGDLVAEVGEGESFAGIPYGDFVKAKAGKIAFGEDGAGLL